jgi:ATP-dependent DNA helicase
MKVDVEMSLPPKKEYVLYAPLSVRQREAYDRVLNRGLRKWLIHGETGGVEVVDDDEVIENNDIPDEVEAKIKDDKEREGSGSRQVPSGSSMEEEKVTQLTEIMTNISRCWSVEVSMNEV